MRRTLAAMGLLLAYLAIHASPCVGESGHPPSHGSGHEQAAVATDAAPGHDTGPGCHEDAPDDANAHHDVCLALPRTADNGLDPGAAALALPVILTALPAARLTSGRPLRRRCRRSARSILHTLCVLRR